MNTDFTNGFLLGMGITILTFHASYFGSVFYSQRNTHSSQEFLHEAQAIWNDRGDDNDNPTGTK